MKFDFFICHATEDKESFVRPLAIQLINRGYKVWYDEFSLKIGDDLRERIDHGLSNSRKGIIVLSPHFFTKEWTKRELAGLTAKEMSGKLVILPIWHNISKEDILKYSPPLAGKYAAKSSDGLREVVNKIIESIADGQNNVSKIFDSGKIRSKNKYNKRRTLIVKVPSPFGKGINYNLLDKEEGRRFLEIGLVELIKKYRRKSIYILIADIDQLTLINKTYGVAVGDKVLDSIFSIIYAETKKYKHITGRCGDDTFFSTLLNIGSGKIRNVPTQIIHNINRKSWNAIASNLRVSCTIGYAEMRSEEDIRDSIIRAYHGVVDAKSTGEKLKAGPLYLPKTETFSYSGGFGWS